MFNEDNFCLAYKVCEALNNHETMVKFAEWEVALHATELAYLIEHAKSISEFYPWLNNLYDNEEYKLCAELLNVAIDYLE